MPRLNTHAYSLAPRRVISFAAPAFREIQLYANAEWPIRNGVDECLPMAAGKFCQRISRSSNLGPIYVGTYL